MNENKTNINWYPGHMAKTIKEIEADLKLVDLVIEILDARIPVSSQNPDINRIVKDKKKIVVLNKKDLAEEVETQRWINYYSKLGISAIDCDSSKEDDVKRVFKLIEKNMQEEKEKALLKGRNKIIRAMIIGIPNSGKSSFINRLSKTKAMASENRPGVTRQKQWLRLDNNIELLDTPGVLWPRIEDNKAALPLAFTGSIKDDILDSTELAYNLVKFLVENNYKKKLIERYDIDYNIVDEVLNSNNMEENEKIVEIMNLIGRKRGCIQSRGEINLEKTSNVIITDYRQGKLGRITLEKAKMED